MPLFGQSIEQQKRDMIASISQFGFGCLPEALDEKALLLLHEEAKNRLSDAVQAESNEDLKYRAKIAGLGECMLSLLKSEEYLSLLQEAFGGRYALSEEISCYTHYSSDDHIGAHQDGPTDKCAVTIIVYLEAHSPRPDAAETGLVLNIYGEEAESVGQITLQIPTSAGAIALGLGSRYWHERPKLQPGEEVIAVTGCYRRIG